jgi:Flp pilus assembly pilin Flp
LIGYLISPTKTLDRISRFADWTRTRSQVEYAGILALIGLILIGVGWSHL